MTQKEPLNLNQSNLWTPFKELYSSVEAAVIRKEPDALSELESLLRINKPNFVSLLKNVPQNALTRQALSLAPTEGLQVKGQSQPQILPKSLIEEALVISNMFDLNEMTALELLITGQQQQPSFPGLTHGLVAVLLYYDGRRSIVNALRILVQGREGRTWTLGLNRELAFMVTKYTDELKEDGVLNRIFQILESNDPVHEVDLLQRNRALGSPRYRKLVTDLIEEIPQSLAEVVFCWSCQSTLQASDVKRLIRFLFKHVKTKGDGSLDSVSVTMLMAFLYTIDVSELQTMEEMDQRVKMLPLVQDPQLIHIIHKEVMNNKNCELQGVAAILQFAWALSLRTLSQYSWALEGIEVSEILELDEKVLYHAMGLKVFQSFNSLVVQSSVFHHEEFYVKRVHSLVTDFIYLMPLKVKEIRNQGDEAARIILAHRHEGLEPPSNLNRHFEHFMGLIEHLYKEDHFHLDLAFEFWCPSDSLHDLQSGYSHRLPQRQLSMYKFLRLAGDLLPSPLFVPYIKMLSSLSQSQPSAHQCFLMLKTNGKSSGSQSSMVSWDHFFESLHQYYSSLRQEIPSLTEAQYLYRQRPHSRGITPQEVEGLMAILKLTRKVAEKDDLARIAIWENPHYSPGLVMVGLVGCSIPPEVKGDLLKVLAGFAESQEIALNIWEHLELSQIIPTIKSLSTYQPSGVHIDLVEVESRVEEYPLTRATLLLIKKLVTHPLPLTLGTGQRKPGIDPYVDYVKDTVFLPYQTRAYKNVGEKWKLGSSCVEVMLKLLKDYYVPQNDLIGQSLDFHGGMVVPFCHHPGYTLMGHLLQDSLLLKLILSILDEGI